MYQNCVLFLSVLLDYHKDSIFLLKKQWPTFLPATEVTIMIFELKFTHYSSSRSLTHVLSLFGRQYHTPVLPG